MEYQGYLSNMECSFQPLTEAKSIFFGRRVVQWFATFFKIDRGYATKLFGYVRLHWFAGVKIKPCNGWYVANLQNLNLRCRISNPLEEAML